MCAMHADELPIDAALVTRLITEQFPRWTELPIERIATLFWDRQRDLPPRRRYGHP